MRKKNVSHNNTVKKIRLVLSLFAAYTGFLFLMSGVHTGLLVLMSRLQCGEVVQPVVAMAYWGIVAAGITWFAVGKIRNTYEIPMQRLAEATSKVAAGDFSVYVPTLHTADKLDYLDVMIMDFNKMVEELGSIETLKTDFVSNVSHEMKTPIAIIKNYAELLSADKIEDEQRKAYAESIENAATRLSDLIGNILKLNKLENQRITPEAEDYDVCRQLCECILQFEDAWEEKEIELEAEIEDAATVRADASLMELVWNNLLSNALKFTEPGGSVTVRQISDENYIRVSVSDTGCGMGQESMKHIFDKFYQGDTSHSKEGNGSTFTVTLPVAGMYTGQEVYIYE